MIRVATGSGKIHLFANEEAFNENREKESPGYYGDTYKVEEISDLEAGLITAGLREQIKDIKTLEEHINEIEGISEMKCLFNLVAKKAVTLGKKWSESARMTEDNDMLFEAKLDLVCSLGLFATDIIEKLSNDMPELTSALSDLSYEKQEKIKEELSASNDSLADEFQNNWDEVLNKISKEETQYKKQILDVFAQTNKLGELTKHILNDGDWVKNIVKVIKEPEQKIAYSEIIGSNEQQSPTVTFLEDPLPFLQAIKDMTKADIVKVNKMRALADEIIEADINSDQTIISRNKIAEMLINKNEKIIFAGLLTQLQEEKTTKHIARLEKEITSLKESLGG